MGMALRALSIVAVLMAAAPASLHEAGWRWTTEAGREVSLAHWRGTPVVLVPFYASCRVRCPITIEKVRRVEAAYHARGLTAAVVLVTLDPREDTPERLARFKQSAGLPPSWTLLRGDGATTQALSRALGVRATPDDAHIDHQVRVVVLDEEGRIARNLDGWGFSAEDAVLSRSATGPTGRRGSPTSPSPYPR
jgi:cytochrome oxidase Cu insertion factor (SCO1/SenC/PrrC family)